MMQNLLSATKKLFTDRYDFIRCNFCRFVTSSACPMLDDQTYKQFVAQFNLSEWKRLCKHRLFLHFLKIDLKTAASIASEALDRPVAYTFPKALKPAKKKSTSAPTMRRSTTLRNHRRFRI